MSDVSSEGSWFEASHPVQDVLTSPEHDVSCVVEDLRACNAQLTAALLAVQSNSKLIDAVNDLRACATVMASATTAAHAVDSKCVLVKCAKSSVLTTDMTVLVIKIPLLNTHLSETDSIGALRSRVLSATQQEGLTWGGRYEVKTAKNKRTTVTMSAIIVDSLIKIDSVMTRIRAAMLVGSKVKAGNGVFLPSKISCKQDDGTYVIAADGGESALDVLTRFMETSNYYARQVSIVSSTKL